MNGVILAGGRSRRMGRDKAWLRYNNQPLIDIALKKAKEVCHQVYISCRQDQVDEFEQLATTIIDSESNHGPLQGIYSALRFCRSDILVMVVDMPLIDVDTLKKIIDERESNREAVIFHSEQLGIQPFPGIYTLGSLDQLHHNLISKQLSCIQFLKTIDTQKIHPNDSRLFANWNHPTDMEF